MSSVTEIANKLSVSEEEVQQIFTRLRKEKKESLDKDRILGFNLGFKNATSLSYKCMLKIIDTPDTENQDHLDWLIDFEITTHLNTIKSEDKKYNSVWEMIYYENKEVINSEVINRDEFYWAWVRGVNKFLEQI